MATHDLVKIFDSSKIRVVWDDEQEKYFFSVMDVVQVLTDQPEKRQAAKYWSVVKTRLKAEGVELPTICSQLKLVAADGKRYNTDVADLEGILRIIQSIPSKKAEPIKRWLAQVGNERFLQLQDPERSIEQVSKNRMYEKSYVRFFCRNICSTSTNYPNYSMS